MRIIRLALTCLILCAIALMVAPGLLPAGGQAIMQSDWAATGQSPRPAQFSSRDSLALKAKLTHNPTYAPGPDLGEKRHLRDGLMPRSYMVYTPTGLKSPAPAVLLFHGSGRTGRSMIDMWRATADRHGLVLLALNGRSGNWTGEDASAVHALIKVLPDRHQTDPNQLYLFGHSAGAVFVHFLVNRFDGPWRAAATHAGYSRSTPLLPRDNGAPIRSYLGTSDHIFHPNGARDAGRGLADHGHRFELVLIPRHTHWFYALGPEIAEDSWGWLRAQPG